MRTKRPNQSRPMAPLVAGVALLLVAALAPVAAAHHVPLAQCTIIGTEGPDHLTGTPGSDVICGLGGDDTLIGGDLADTLIGGDGNDVLDSGPGNDVLEGDAGDDELLASSGNDLLYGGPGADRLLGHTDADYLNGGEDGDEMLGGLHTDTCVIGAGDAAASCSRESPHDRDDAGGVLDISRVVVGGTTSVFTWQINTFSTWTTSGVRDRGYFLVYLETRGDAEPEYYALIRSNGTSMIASLYRDLATDQFVQTLAASRPGANSVKVEVPLSALTFASTRLFLRWYAVTLYTSSSCPDVCIDRVPATDGLIRPII